MKNFLHFDEGALQSPSKPSSDTPDVGQLSAIQKLLLKGQRAEAVQLAMNARLWAHALVISGHVDKTTYDGVIAKFAEQHFSVGEPLRTLYGLFGGQATKPSKPTRAVKC
jgi:hypothetical protein